MEAEVTDLRAQAEVVRGNFVAVAPPVVSGLVTAVGLFELVIERVGAPQWHEHPVIGRATDALRPGARVRGGDHAVKPDARLALLGRLGTVASRETHEVRRSAAVLAARNAVAVMGGGVMALEIAAPRPPGEDRGGAVGRALAKRALNRDALVGDGGLRDAVDQIADEVVWSSKIAYSWRLALSTIGTIPPVKWSTALPE